MDIVDATEAIYAAAIAAGLRLHKAHSSSGRLCLQCGYSYVDCGGDGIFARREGEDDVGSRPLRHDYDDAGAFVAWAVDVLSAGRTVECGKGVDLRSIRDYVSFQTVDYPLQYLAGVIRRPDDPWNLDSDYQRGHVWTDRQAEQFMGHLLENGRTPLIFLWEQWEFPFEVIDGKQRLTACLRFLDGEIGAELSDGRRIFWRDFDEVDRRCVPSITCARVRLKNRAEVMRFYIKLNRGGSVHTDAEIDRVKALLAAEEEKS